MKTLPKNQFLRIGERLFEIDSMTNATPSILDHVMRQFPLFQRQFHPLNLLYTRVQSYFSELGFSTICHVDPIVTLQQNFDDLLFPRDHIGRTQHDSYFLNQTWMLRTHMTANEREIMRENKDHDQFLIVGDVYRRDEIDKNHYPVFHQIEGVKLFSNNFKNGQPEKARHEQYENSSLRAQESIQYGHDPLQVQVVLADLQNTVNNLLNVLFPKSPIRWQPCYFPFTHPSLEIEIFHNGKWLEVCGSGVLQQSFVDGSGREGMVGWAFGLGLERLAMILYDIPDIRLFWSRDRRFLDQFAKGDKNIKFVPFSKHPPVYRDVSFWIQSDFQPNDFFDLVREIGGNLIEDLSLVG